jgi:SAM-dependent methyltransferase
MPTRAALDIFRCPECHAELDVLAAAQVRCGSCGLGLDACDGVIDFVPSGRRGSERAFYDDYYESSVGTVAMPDPADLPVAWTGVDAAWEMQRVWRRLGDLHGRIVLVLGNGASTAELHMLAQHPRALVYSDLSPVGLRAFGRGLNGAGADGLVLAAMDALDLPLRDASVDVVYGFAFVHHLPELERFLGEVARVLRPGGHCVFMDDAHSPAWQWLKLRWMRPLMRWSHRHEPRSPEDLRETLSGGFREARLTTAICSAGGEPWFERVALLYYVWMRAAGVLLPAGVRRVRAHHLAARACRRIDEALLRTAWGRRNMVRLIWGFRMPDQPARQGA